MTSLSVLFQDQELYSKKYQYIELAAFEQRGGRLLLELIMQDPWTRSAIQAEEAPEETLALNFNAEMREYYC